MAIETDINKNVKDIKNNTYGKKILDRSNGYKTGALIGAASGFLIGWMWRKNLIFFTLGGVVLGGYIGYKIKENGEPTMNFKNNGIKED